MGGAGGRGKEGGAQGSLKWRVMPDRQPVANQWDRDRQRAERWQLPGNQSNPLSPPLAQ